jgi:hypothetical protein
MAAITNRLKQVLLSVRLFSRLVIQIPLRAYQVEPAQAVIESCLGQKGLEFLWVFPRQSGKDEAIAQLCTFLLTLFQRVEAAIIHVYPTGGQIATGVGRLENRLENLWTSGHWWSKAKPTRRGLGLSQIAFFSGHPQARAEGATANLLLIINEVQDQDEAIVERRFTPMRASANATALYVGTVRTTGDFLWKTKSRLEKQQRRDGQQRVFILTAHQVGQENRHYKTFVAGQVAKYGRQHPVVKTEYYGEPVDVAAGLFPRRRLTLMQGDHPRLSQPQPGQVYIALIDVGGQDEGATEAFAELENPERDYTCCTIVRAIARPGEIGPRYEAVDVFADQGSRHFQEHPGRPSLFEQMVAYLRHWRVAAVVIDSSGVGQGISDALGEKLSQPVFPFDFSKNHGKSRLGNNFLAIIETGRFKYFTEGRGEKGEGRGEKTSPPAGGTEGGRKLHPEELSDRWWFFTQAEHCGYELAPGVPIERGMRWGVPASAKVYVDVDKTSHPVHDDRLLSAALLAEADERIRQGDLFLSSGQSAVIQRERKRDDKWS